MIVKQSSRGWLMIYQAAHGLLAGKIANRLKKKLRPKYWLETITAILEHDDHQLRFDEKLYLNEIGLPIDFVKEETADDKVLERAKRIYKKARIKSKYTALLVSLHLDFLYGEMNDAGMKDFLQCLKSNRDEIEKLYGLQEKEVNEIYQILRFCDRCSLILCKNQLPAMGRSLEINTSILGETYYISKNDENKINVEPWPFEENQFELSIEQMLVESAEFKDNAALKKALANSKTELLQWVFQKN
ncbi:DUF3891 family protein [Costertonia aggregata]|uniref:DUF3891 family protein n=1 Tax=Costertonia aggregata TaxID=343403 RepID=A0A7H9ANI2_9FLAO|nr:DUF3891 family protein [Costertonia aggregata]QLG44988.1 DUF3891 family protein [Costertonia aggregata]